MGFEKICPFRAKKMRLYSTERHIVGFVNVTYNFGYLEQDLRKRAVPKFWHLLLK